jgi:hypothetical protein
VSPAHFDESSPEVISVVELLREQPIVGTIRRKTLPFPLTITGPVANVKRCAVGA